MADLRGHRALVTGGARGIGRAVAQRLAADGARVAILDIEPDIEPEDQPDDQPDDPPDDESGDGPGSGPGTAAGAPGPVLRADVSDGDAVTAAVRAAAEEMDGLSILVGNAGVGALKPLHRYRDDEWARLLAVNLTGVWHGIRAAVPLLRASAAAGRPASIVNVAGTTASRPTRGEGPYSAAKAGVVALSRGAAVELAPDVRVNVVSPGYVATRMTRAVADDPALRARVEDRIPLGRMGTVDDVAGVVAFLCSEDAAYVTGQELVVDGGGLLPSHQSDELLKGLLASWG